MSPPPFNPRYCQFGLYPFVPPNEHPYLALNSQGAQVGYLQAVLKCKSGQAITIAPLWGPWIFGATTYTALRNFQAFWGQPVTGVTSTATWGLINWAAKGFPT